MSTIAEVLKASALFKGFTDTGLQILAGIAHERTFPPGTPLFVEGMLGDSLFVLGSGRVRISAKTHLGEEISIGELDAGECLGELSLVTQSPRMCTATALSPVRVAEIRAGDFQRLMAQKPQACAKLLMGIVALFGQKVVENRDNFRAMLGRK